MIKRYCPVCGKIVEVSETNPTCPHCELPFDTLEGEEKYLSEHLDAAEEAMKTDKACFLWDLAKIGLLILLFLLVLLIRRWLS